MTDTPTQGNLAASCFILALAIIERRDYYSDTKERYYARLSNLSIDCQRD